MITQRALFCLIPAAMALLLLPAYTAELVYQTAADIPLEKVLSQVDAVIPREMSKHNIPGISIALIRNARVVWMKGYGIRSTMTGEPVTPDTVFKAASFSKPITAFLAMILAERGVVSLNSAAENYVQEKFSPKDKQAGRITIAHLMSHSSGLSNNMLWEDRGVNFPPGTRFSYSGVGFQYLQRVIESVLAQPYDRAVEREVLTPLMMASSSYIWQTRFDGNFATGHSSDGYMPMAFALGYMVLACLIWALLYLPKKWIRFPHGAEKYLKWAWLPVSILVFLPISAFIFNAGIPMALFSTAIGAVCIAVVLYFRKLFCDNDRFVIRHGAGIFIAAAAAGVLITAGNYISIPLPMRQFSKPNAAASLYSTPGDMARFMIELMEPKLLGRKRVDRYLTPRMTINESISWGLGIGLQKHGDHYDFWHWGHMPDYQNFFIGCPRKKSGLVIMTNSTNGLDAVPAIVKAATGIEQYPHWNEIPLIFIVTKR